MKKQGIAVILVLVLCATAFCKKNNEPVSKSSRGTTKSDIHAVRAALDQWVQLYNARQFEILISTLYADDAVLLAPNIPACKGREAILMEYKKDDEANEEHVNTTLVEEVHISGDLAVARGSDTGTTRPRRGGPAEKYSLKWLMVMKREADGSWKFIDEMWNEDAAAQDQRK